jgi:Ni2+-binding GTPase involved in maturation of urease and hydrogenase
MNKLGTNLYVNFEYKLVKPKAKVRAAVMGACGNGKTSLINKLCNTSHRVGVEAHSLTRDIAFEHVILDPHN